MKRFSLIAAALVSLLTLSSCAAATHGADEKPRVVTTIFPQYDFVRAIAGDTVSLEMLVPPGSESHTYEPTVADLRDVIDADIFISTGSDTDEWATAVEDAVEESDVKFLHINDAVESGGHDHVDDDGKVEHHGDEHLWTSPDNAEAILYYILDELIDIAPENEQFYRRNADAYAERLRCIGDEFEEIATLARERGATFVVADRFPFEALFERYGIAYAAALDGCAVGVEPTAERVGELLDIIDEGGISSVFYIEFSNRAAADFIASETGCGELLLHSCHNVDIDDFEGGVTFCDLMERNAENMREALGVWR